MDRDEIEFVEMDSPVGRIRIGAGPKGIRMVESSTTRRKWKKCKVSKFGKDLSRAKRELDEYFKGKRSKFTIKTDTMDGTPFQQKVWRELRRIPFGKVITYGELAHRIGCPSGARAVGQANGANPISIIIPCHRVIAVGRKIGGYGGGLRMKRFLLDLEGVEGF